MNRRLRDFDDILQPALDLAGGTHTLDDIEAAVLSGEMQFWPGPTSAIITQVEVTPQRRLLHFFLAGGTIQEIEAMLPPILAWGAEKGCSGATLCGRAGWQRSFLTKQGWAPQGVLMGMEFSEGRTDG